MADYSSGSMDIGMIWFESKIPRSRRGNVSDPSAQDLCDDSAWTDLDELADVYLLAELERKQGRSLLPMFVSSLSGNRIVTKTGKLGGFLTLYFDCILPLAGLSLSWECWYAA